MEIKQVIKEINKYLEDNNNGTPEFRAALFVAMDHLQKDSNKRRKIIHAG